jgi:hypothetical protein
MTEWATWGPCTEIGCAAPPGQPCLDTRYATPHPARNPHPGRPRAGADHPKCGHGRGFLDHGPVCQFRARHPSGLCGIHENQRLRDVRREEARLRREEFRRSALARNAASAHTLFVAGGITCEPTAAGVLIPTVEAEKLARRLARGAPVSA